MVIVLLNDWILTACREEPKIIPTHTIIQSNSHNPIENNANHKSKHKLEEEEEDDGDDDDKFNKEFTFRKNLIGVKKQKIETGVFGYEPIVICSNMLIDYDEPKLVTMHKQLYL